MGSHTRGLILLRAGRTIARMSRALSASLPALGALVLFAAPAAAQRGPGAFAGTYSVTSNTTVNVTSPISTTESRTTHERAEARPGSRADLAFHVSNSRGDRCVLEGNLSGANAVICPMVNTPEDAARLVACTRYAPRGTRSHHSSTKSSSSESPITTWSAWKPTSE